MDEIAARLSGAFDDEASLPPGLNADDTLLVSRRVVAGAPVLFVWRDEPDEDDSGWTLLAGTESDDESGDPSAFERRDVTWALEQDGSLFAVLGAPPDSTYERDGVGADWVELVDG